MKSERSNGELTSYIGMRREGEKDPDAPFRANFLGGLNFSVPVYRTIPLRWFRHFLKTGLLALSNPAVCWRKIDPFEQLMETAIVKKDSGSMPLSEVVRKLRGPVFGQCWSRVAESDAIWRIYSQPDREEGEGVRRGASRQSPWPPPLSLVGRDTVSYIFTKALIYDNCNSKYKGGVV